MPTTHFGVGQNVHMKSTNHKIKEAIEIVRKLSPDDIRRRLDEIDAEEKRLRVLLRSAVAYESALNRRSCEVSK